ncbi:MAG: ABC transporter permease, partial [Chloroflexi bacterium]|nr:ABC transporter permease [Chloroflexota bacterium]
MTRFLARRLLLLVPVLLGISIITFSLIRLIPGDPARVMLGEHATAEQVARFRERMGLDDPLHTQYLRYLQSLLQGDLGRAIKTNEWVAVELAQRLPATIELTLGAMLVACVLGLSAGIVAAYRHNTSADLLTMVAALLGVSMPVFWLGLVLQFLFGFKLPLLPPSMRLTVGVELIPLTEHYALESRWAGTWAAGMLPVANFVSNFYVLNSLLTGNMAAL